MKIATKGTIKLSGTVSYTETDKGTRETNHYRIEDNNKDITNIITPDNVQTKELKLDGITIDIDTETTADMEGMDIIKAGYKAISDAIGGILAGLNAR